MNYLGFNCETKKLIFPISYLSLFNKVYKYVIMLINVANINNLMDVPIKGRNGKWYSGYKK